MKRRIVAAALLVVMLMSMLAACGGDAPSTNQVGGNFVVPEGGYDGSAVTISFYNTMGTNLAPILEAYIAEFNKLYPNITIESVNVGGYDDVRDQIATEITEGNQPNIAYCYPDHVAMYNLAKAVTTLDTLIESQIEVTHADGTTEILGLTEEQKADFI